LSFIEWLQLKTEDEKILFVQDWLNKLLAFQLFKIVEIDDTVIKQLTQFIDNITNTKSIADVFVAWETFVANFLKSDKHKTLSSLADLLTYYYNMDLSIDYDKKQQSITPVILSTIHASKGLEYDVVFLMGCEAGNWESKGKINEAINVPKLLNNFINSDSDDEEDLRRVVYVGMTRAKKLLNISYNRFSKSGKPQEITKLINPLLENQLLNEVLVETQDLPGINQDVYHVNADQGLMELINEKLSSFHISSSSINNFLDCQNRFFFQNICKIEGLPNVAASFGSLVHKILEIVSQEKQLPVLESKIQQVAERIFPSFQYNFHPLHREKYKQYSIQVVTNYLNDFPIISAPLHIEKYLTTIMQSGVELNGFIDRIDQISGNLSIIDYKTSKYPEVLKPFVNDEEPGTSFWRQAMIYYYLVRNNFNDVESSDFYFHYVVLNKKIQFERQENLAFEDWVLGIWNQINSLKYLKYCSNKDCNYCKGKLNN
jgi:DNA helicase-2/ATP-dependent DNA helicase PcrA